MPQKLTYHGQADGMEKYCHYLHEENLPFSFRLSLISLDRNGARLFTL